MAKFLDSGARLSGFKSLFYKIANCGTLGSLLNSSVLSFLIYKAGIIRALGDYHED